MSDQLRHSHFETGWNAARERLQSEVERLRATQDALVNGQEKYLLEIREKDREIHRLRAVTDAARAFAQHHQSKQPWQPGNRDPNVWDAQEAWHDEDDRRLQALISAVSALDAEKGTKP